MLHFPPGKYVPSLAFKIHNENRLKNRKMKLALKGIMIGSGYSDPINQNEYGDYLYNIGLIDTNQRAIFYAEEDSIRKLIRAKKWREATDVNMIFIRYEKKMDIRNSKLILFL